MAVHAIGFPQGRAPFRVADSELGNLPARFDAGWYLTIATTGYEYLPNRFDRQQNLVFFPAFPTLMSAGVAGAGTAGAVERHARLDPRLRVGVALPLPSGPRADGRRPRRRRGDVRWRSIRLRSSTAPPTPKALFLLAMLGAWYHLRRDERWPAFGWGLLAGLTRPNGCLLSIPLALVVAGAAVAARPAAASAGRLGQSRRPDGRGRRARARHADLLGLRLRPHRRPVHVDPPAGGVGPAEPRACRRSCSGSCDSVGEQGVYRYVEQQRPRLPQHPGGGAGRGRTHARSSGASACAPAVLLVLNVVPSHRQRRVAVGGTGHGGALPDVPLAGRCRSGAPADGLVRARSPDCRPSRPILFFTWRPLF